MKQQWQIYAARFNALARRERGMVAAQIMTSPGHIVTVPRVTGPIRFEKAGQ